MPATRKFSLRPISMTVGSIASMAARAAAMRSAARPVSYIALPDQSSIEMPATPVSTAAATLTATSSGASAKPFSKSALTGRSVAATSRRRCASTSSRLISPSSLPAAQAAPALVEAIALKPSRARRTALPASQALGMTKKPLAWRSRKTLRRAAVVIVTRPWGLRPGHQRRHGPRNCAKLSMNSWTSAFALVS